MHKKLIFLLLMAGVLIAPQLGWTQDMPMESGDVLFPGEADYPYSTQPGWGMNKQASGERQRLFFHGYGELQYKSPNGGTANMDFHRFVWGISYEISDRIMLHTEVDFEHAANELELEFAYLDFDIIPAFNIRAGSMLMPVGPLNEFHEPVLFYSVKRPSIYGVIIPTTWQEGGVGIYGTPTENFRYRIYLVSGLNGTRFNAGKGIRDGRGKVAGGENQPNSGEDLAVVGRFEYNPTLEVALGTSLYYGAVDQENSISGDPTVAIYEFDARVRTHGFDFQAVYARVDIEDADKINAAHVVNGTVTPLTGNASVGEELVGWHVEAAYHLSNLLGTTWDLVPFIRYAENNTQDDVPSGFSADPANDKTILTVGVSYFPHPQVAVKADYQDKDNESATSSADQFNLGIAYMF